MSATPGQKKLVELLLSSRELHDSVAVVVDNLVDDEEMTGEEGVALIEALMNAPEGDEFEWRVGGIIKG